jgi:hypothetical protein
MNLKSSLSFVVFRYVLGVLLVSTSASAQQWTKLAPSNPPPARFNHTLMSDSANDRAIMFGGAAACGGLSDVWLLTHASGLTGAPAWSQLAPPGIGPDARYGANAVYDAASNRMIVFGGAAGSYCVGVPPLRNDVWVLTNANGLGGPPAWIRLSPSGSPPAPRAASTSVYDPSSNRLIVFGGNRNVGNCFFESNDTWILKFANGLGETPPEWINANPSDGPPIARFQHTAVYDASANEMIVFGGQNSCGGTGYADAWALVNANGVTGAPKWVSLGNAPSVQSSHSAVLDAAQHRMLTFGGSSPGLTNGVRAMSNTNTTTGQTWTSLTPAGTPPSPRYSPGAVFDDVRRSMIVFGGNNSPVIVNDTWVYNLGPTATTLNMPAATGTFGGTTTLQATLSSASGPVSGMSVNFSLFGANVGSATTASNGIATLNDVSLSGRNAGTYSGVAGGSFAGSGNYLVTSATTDLTVNGAPASISVTGGGTFPYDGSAHSASAQVAGVFGESLGSAPITYMDLSNGSTSSAAPINVGSYRVNASFAGNSNYLNGSNSSITITITQASTPTSVASSANPSAFGQSVTFTATVSAAAPGAGTPTGTVTVNDGAATIGAGTLNGGATTISTSSLTAGSHSITAVYSGDASYNTSTSAVLSQTVNAPTAPGASFTANPNPCACNQVVGFDASGSSATTIGRRIVNWAWDFGDGTSLPASGPSQAHAYSSFGTYAVTLTVTDDNVPPLSAATTRPVNVNQGNQPPMANAGGPYNVNFGSAVQLNGGNSSDPNTSCGDHILSYAWTIDGTVHLSGPTASLNTAVNGLSVGPHNVSLTVTDSFGAISTASASLNVSRVLVSIAVTPSSATVHPNQGGQQFTATGTFSDGSTQILQSGGHGGSGGGPSAAHWNIHFTPMIAVSACATAQYPAPIDYSSQAFTPDSTTGAFQEIWSVSTPVLEVSGLLTPTQVTQTLRCTTPSLTTAGEISATWTGTRYEGTFSFGGSTGQVSITGWSSKMPMPSPRAGLGAAFVDGKVYAVGGVGGNCDGVTPCDFGPLRTVESYDPGTNAWTAGPSLNVGREGAGVAALGGKTYTIGGHVPGGDPSGVVEVFDPSSSNAWTTLPESEWMPTARAHFALVTDGTYLYALGGDTQANNLGHVATVERYNPSAHTWSTLTPMPVAGTSSGAGFLNGTIVVVGSDGTSRTDVYDIATDTWHDGVPMPAQRGAMAAGVANGGLWVVGGTSNGSPAYGAWVYYPATDRRPEGWGFGGSMPTARWGLAAAVVGDVVYAIGGAVGSSGAFGVTTNESLSTPPNDDLSTSQGSSGGSGGGGNGSLTVQWQSANPSVADVDSNGFANQHALGQTTIAASVGNISGEAALTVSNAAPTLQITGRLNGPPPSPPFLSGPFTIGEGSQFQLNAVASDPDNDPLTYAWSIVSGTGTLGSQGGNTSGSSLNYTNFDGPSSATVQVVVTDSFGATATATATITVNNVAPTVQTFNGPFTTSESRFTNFGTGANFFDSGTNDGPWTVTVDYGDGTPAQMLPSTTSPAGFGTFGNFSLNHSYGDNGNYTVTLSVTDKDHDTGTTTMSVAVNNVAPQVFLPPSASTPAGSSATWGCASFSDQGAGDAPWTATVNYGDGTGEQTIAVNVPGSCGGGGTPTGAFNLSHAYASGGSYTVTVNITDKDHATGTATTQVSVNAPPSVTINTPLGPLNEGSASDISGSFTDGSTDGPWTIEVTYGDNTGQSTLPQANSPGSFTFSHVYKDNGTYAVTVQVTDRFFATGSTSMNVTVDNVVPTVTLPSSAGPINEGQSMFITGSFFDPGVNDNFLPTFRGTVNYGDGTPTQTLTNPNFSSAGRGSFSLNHTYADNPAAPATTFIVTLTVTDKDGGTSAAATMPVTVVNATPRAMLNGGPQPRQGYPATFRGSVFDQGANDAPWTGTVNYGDGTPTENLTLTPGVPPNSPQNTWASFTSTHTYAQSGSFTLTLTTTDKDGATGTTTFPSDVKPVLVSIAITPNLATKNAAGQTVLFNATATFSDGSTFSSNGQVVEGLTWSSSNTSAATIGLGGLATAIAPGTTTITGYGEDDMGGSFSGHATLTVDFTPPVITAADVSAEATSGAGAPVTFSFSATDDLDPHPTVGADQVSGATFPIGTTNVIVTATDWAGNPSTKTFHVTVVETTRPTITLLGMNPMTVEGGSTFSDPGATATDNVAGNLTGQIQVTGSVNAHVVGSYALTYTVSDGYNTATETRTVNVVDTTRPMVTTSGNVTVDATSPAGRVATFSSSATDIVDGAMTPICTPASGSTFAIGVTTVTCSATDAHHNTGSAALSVTVLSSEQIVWNLISQVGTLDFKQASSLLQNVLTSLSRENTGAACNQLTAFINQVQTQRTKSLTDAEATALIGSATGARSALACQ